GYTTLIEPGSPLHLQEWAWFYLFFIVALLILVVTFFLRRQFTGPSHILGARLPDVSALLAWVALSALPSFMLVAVTNQITQRIAPVPLLWVVPLSIYLVTLIIAFAGFGQSRYVPLAFLGSTIWAYAYLAGLINNVPHEIASFLVLLFLC